MAVLFITLGNSEIQFDEHNLGDFRIIASGKSSILTKGDLSLNVRKNNRPQKGSWWLPESSREGGAYILQFYEDFKNILQFPIVETLIEFINREGIKHILFIVTDQTDPKHRTGDTLHYATILEKHFRQALDLGESIKFSTIEITENVRDLDFQYENFKKSLEPILNNQGTSEEKIYLFAQGGIDQINHALTLQLLQKYKSSVRIYQKPEDESLKEVLFPHLFLKDLNRQKIIKHLEDYDFGKAIDITLSEPVISQLCIYANNRLQLKTDTAFLMANNFGKKHLHIIGPDLVEQLKTNWKELTFIEKNKIKIQDLIYSIRIDVLQKNYNQALIKFFTLFF